MNSITAKWKSWLTAPLSPSMSLTDWILLTVAATTLSFLWTLVLSDFFGEDD